MDLLADLRSRQQPKVPLSTIPMTNVGRRQSSLNAVRRSIGIVEPESSSVDMTRRNSVAWQTMNQNLNLQLEQQRRKSELVSRRLQSISASEKRHDHIAVPVDDEKGIEVIPSVTISRTNHPIIVLVQQIPYLNSNKAQSKICHR